MRSLSISSTSAILEATFSSIVVMLVFELVITIFSSTVQLVIDVFERHIMIVASFLISSLFPNVSTRSWLMFWLNSETAAESDLQFTRPLRIPAWVLMVLSAIVICVVTLLSASLDL